MERVKRWRNVVIIMIDLLALQRVGPFFPGQRELSGLTRKEDCRSAYSTSGESWRGRGQSAFEEWNDEKGGSKEFREHEHDEQNGEDP